MNTHDVECEVPTITDESGNPASVPAPTGRKVACATCGKTGWPEVVSNPRHWLRGHRYHVRCTCGDVVTERGHGAHKGARGRFPLKVAE